MAIAAKFHGSVGLEIIQVEMRLTAPHKAKNAGLRSTKTASHWFRVCTRGQQMRQGEAHRAQASHAQPFAPSHAVAKFCGLHPQRNLFHLYSPMRSSIVYRTPA